MSHAVRQCVRVTSCLRDMNGLAVTAFVGKRLDVNLVCWFLTGYRKPRNGWNPFHLKFKMADDPDSHIFDTQIVKTKPRIVGFCSHMVLWPCDSRYTAIRSRKQVKNQGHNETWPRRNLSAAKTSVRRDRLTEYRLGENYPSVVRNILNLFKFSRSKYTANINMTYFRSIKWK